MNQCAYLIIHQIKDVMVSPLFCGSGKAVEVIPPTTMKSSASVEVKMNVDCTCVLLSLFPKIPLMCLKVQAWEQG